MLNKYLELLKKGIESFKHLGRNSSWLDYLHTIRYEFLILFIILITIAAVILIITTPTIGTHKINKLFKKKSTYEKIKKFILLYNDLLNSMVDKFVYKYSENQYEFCKQSINKLINSIENILNYDCITDNEYLIYLNNSLSNIKTLLSDPATMTCYKNQKDIEKTELYIQIKNLKAQYKSQIVMHGQLKGFECFKNRLYGICDYNDFLYFISAFPEINNLFKNIKIFKNKKIDLIDTKKYHIKNICLKVLSLASLYIIYGIFIIPLIMMLF